ncbi:MAG: hypothetical protein GEU28_14725, partial [Dehalococcoidia bacterium]|nr:hypothetical protein [Dehalococcoidia bacterium]
MSASALGAAVVHSRVERLRELAANAGLEAVVLTNSASIAYLTGFRGLQHERTIAAVVRADGGGALVAPILDREGVQAAPTRLDHVLYEYTSHGMPELIGELGGASAVGVEENDLSFARASALKAAGVTPQPAGDLIMGLRARKDTDEVEHIRAACTLIGDALDVAFGRMQVGETEAAVNARTESWLRQRGAAVARSHIRFGECAVDGHGRPGPRTLAEGDM